MAAGVAYNIDLQALCTLVQERGLTGRAPHSAAGDVPVVLNPIRFAATPVRDPQGAPLLGEHTAAVAHEFGLTVD